jgi:hypothetical protein
MYRHVARALTHGQRHPRFRWYLQSLAPPTGTSGSGLRSVAKVCFARHLRACGTKE